MSVNTKQKTKEQPSKREPLWSLTFVLITVVSLFASMQGNGVHNGVSVLIENAGGEANLSGIIVGCFAFTALFARFVSGSWSDKAGRKIVIIVGTLFLIAGCSLGAFTEDTILLLPARVLMGFGFSMVVTCCSAAVADVVPKSRMGEGVGYQGLSFALAQAIGPSAAIYLASLPNGRFDMFFVFGIFSACALVFTLICSFKKPASILAAENSTSTEDDSYIGDLVPEAEQGIEDITEDEKRSGFGFVFKFIERRALKPAFVTMIAYLAISIDLAFMAIFAQRKGLECISLFFLLAAVVMILLRIFGGKMFDKYRTNQLLIPGLGCGILGFVLPLVMPCEVTLVISGGLYGLCSGLIQPVLTTEALRRSPSWRRGAASATFYIGCDVGVGVGSFMWGAIITQFGVDAALIGGCIFFALAIVAAKILLKGRRPQRKLIR